MFIVATSISNRYRKQASEKFGLICGFLTLEFSTWIIVSHTHGSVETLFRWSGDSLQHFAAHLFRTLYTELVQNQLSVIEHDKNILAYFLGTRCIMPYGGLSNGLH